MAATLLGRFAARARSAGGRVPSARSPWWTTRRVEAAWTDPSGALEDLQGIRRRRAELRDSLVAVEGALAAPAPGGWSSGPSGCAPP